MQGPGSDAVEARIELWNLIGTQLTLVGYGRRPPIVGEKWEIEKVLGRGGFGLVCAARDIHLGRRAAIKLLPRGPEMLSLLREARSLVILEHPAIVRIFETGEGVVRCDGGALACGWIAMQLVEGVTLDVWVERTRPRVSTVVESVIEIGRALAHAHQRGVMHRDLKPGNVMIDASGRPFVIDFGLAVASAVSATGSVAVGQAADALGARATAAGAVRGTPSYMAPEAVGGRSSPASDQFSLAVLAWEALTGTHPWLASNVASSPRGDPRERPGWWDRVAAVLRRGMQSMPSDRFPSIEAFCEALETAAASRWPRHLASVAVAMVLLAGVSWAVIQWPGSRSTTAASEREGVVAREATPSSDAAPEGEAKLAREAVGRARAVPSATSVEAPAAPLPTPPRAEQACDELDAWAGHWNLTGTVVWTEYSNQLLQVRPLGMSLEPLDGCEVGVQMDKLQPADSSEADEVLTSTTRVTPVRTGDGSWSLVYDVAFPGERRTYDEAENLEFALTLDRSPADEEPRLHGAFSKVQTEGRLVLRTGWVLGLRDRSPTPAEVDANEFPCDARCRILCAGDDAIAACVERGCAPYAAPLAEPCGPPSSDFIAPLRARAERRELIQRRRFGAIVTGKPGDCELNAARIRGRWWLWRMLEDEPELSEVELVSAGCEIQATLRPGGTDEEIAMSGGITAMGIWYLRPDPGAPADLQTLVLAGTGPAFGIDLAEPGRLLRAFRE